ncbi:MAG: hypothetical protein R6W78_12335 [Bacteroidales bacterium]
MARGAQFVQHKGKDIYYVDYSNIKSNEEFLQTIKETNAFREKVRSEGIRDLLILVDISGSYAYGQVLDELKKSGRITKDLSKKEAIVGITKSQKILLQIIKTFTRMQLTMFNTVEEAKDWLVKD